MLEAVAAAAAVPADLVRRAVTLTGDLPAVAAAARRGATELSAVTLAVGRPLAPMLAQSAPDLPSAVERTGPAAVEWKLDGVRVQVHRDGDDVAVFTRTLDDVTDRLPEVVEAARGLRASRAVLDGEVIALQPDGRPRPFQVTSSRAARRDVAPPRARGAAHHRALRRAARRRRGRARRARRTGAGPCSSRWPSRAPRAAACRDPGVDRRCAGGRGLRRRRARAGARGRRRQGPGRALRDGAPGGGLGQGQAAHHARPRRPRRGVGARPAQRMAVEPAPRARDPAGRYGPRAASSCSARRSRASRTRCSPGRPSGCRRWRRGPPAGWSTCGPSSSSRSPSTASSPRRAIPAGLALRFARVLAHRPDKTATQADTIDTVRSYHVPEAPEPAAEG